MNVNKIVAESFDENDECVFGTPSYKIRGDFQNVYRAKIGLCQFDISPTQVTGYLGFTEVKGLYMENAYIHFPYYGQTAKALVARIKRIQTKLNSVRNNDGKQR